MTVSDPTTGAALSLDALRAPSAADRSARPQEDAAEVSFADRLGQAIEHVAAAQRKGSAAATDYELGRTDDIAAVMIDKQVASLNFQLTMEVRNKALKAYKDIMNMPV